MDAPILGVAAPVACLPDVCSEMEQPAGKHSPSQKRGPP